MKPPAAKRPSRLAELDIESEGRTQQDGMAARLARRRNRAGEGMDDKAAARQPQPARDANAWRRGKALLQVAIDEDIHVELSIIAKRRRPIDQGCAERLAQGTWARAEDHQLGRRRGIMHDLRGKWSDQDFPAGCAAPSGAGRTVCGSTAPTEDLLGRVSREWFVAYDAALSACGVMRCSPERLHH